MFKEAISYIKGLFTSNTNVNNTKYQPKLTNQDRQAILLLLEKGETQRKIAKAFNVSQSYISKLKKQYKVA